jgi:methyl-accepting chemotaxis protein
MISFNKVRTRLLAVVAISMVTLSLVAILSSLSFSAKIDKYDALVNASSSDAQSVGELNQLFKTQVQEWKNVLLRGHNAKDLEKYWGRFMEKQQEIQANAKKLASSNLPPESLSLLSAFTIEHNTIISKYREGYRTYLDNNFDHKLADSIVRGIDREPSKLLQESVDVAQDFIQQESLALRSSTKRNALWSYGALLVSLLLSVYVSSHIIQTKVTRPLSSLIAQLKAVSSGKFSDSVIIEGQDEISQMAKAIEKVRIKLSGVVDNLNQNQHELNEVTQSVFHSANSLNQKADEQLDQTSTINDTTSQLAESTSEMQQSVQMGSDSANRASESAKHSLTVMQGILEGVSLSSRQIEMTADVIAQLDEDTKNVGTVVDVINSIADQTNLLALNAAIEAARAGEQGRGFAVVADEVRTLASRTQQSTEEIKAIISTLQERAVNAVNSINTGKESVSESATSIKEASLAISKVDESVTEITDRNTQILLALDGQLRFNDNINNRVDVLKNTSQQNKDLASKLVSQNTRLEEVRGLLENEAMTLQQ